MAIGRRLEQRTEGNQPPSQRRRENEAFDRHLTDSGRKHRLVLLSLALVFLCALSLAPLVGPIQIRFSRLFASDVPFMQNIDAQVFFVARLPRVLLAAVTGAALAVSGLIFQSVLKNPLATPYTLGVASGASLGAVLSIRSGLVVVVFGLSSLTLSAFAGALFAVGLIYVLTQRRRDLSTSVLLLAGVALNFMFSSLILLVHYLSNFTQSYQMLRWMMGGLDVIDYPLISVAAVLVASGLVAASRFTKELNVISTGDELALSRGVDVLRIKRIAYLTASLLTAAVVALTGPIGFVGLVVPHALRLIIGPDNRLLLPASALAGAIALIVCDTIARTVMAPTEIPVGVITSLLGSPCFIWLLLRERRRLSFL